MASQMFHYDEAMTDLILAACRERLSMDPVALDFGGLVESLDAELAGLMRPEGNDAAEVLQLFVDKLSTAVVSCDSPRFLSFIPAAPTKASLLFDMFVSCSSMHGTSWLEAAGVVVAENQALGVLAAQAGLPRGAGGCFVAGGSAGNLSALMVARDTAEHRRHAAAPLRPLVALSEDAHSSVGKALHVLGIGSLTVATHDHRLTGPALRAALREDPRRADVIGVVATAGTTNAGIVDDLAGVADVAAEHSLWFHIDGAYGGAAALFAPSVRAKFAGFERADSFIVDPHKWLFAPFDSAALVYRQPNLAKAVHTQDAQYLEVLHSENPEEWNPSDYAFHLTRPRPGAAAVVLHGGQRPRRLPRGCRGGAGDGPAGGRAGVRITPCRAGARPRALHRPLPAAGMGQGRLRELVRAPAQRADRLRHTDDVGRRDGGPLRLPPSQHDPRDGRRDPRLNGRRVTRRAEGGFPASRRPGRPERAMRHR